MSKPILVIDDEEKFARMLQDILQRNGFHADVCLNPTEGLQMLRRGSYDLVVSDYKMPDMDGAEFLAEARKFYAELPVIMISGLMNMPELIKVANIGVTLVLEKPFDTDDFLRQVARFVKPSSPQASEAVSSREVSELNYGSGTAAQDLVCSFPEPHGLAVESLQNRRFLESLWVNFRDSKHLVFYASKGTEVRLVAREVTAWIEDDPEQPVVLLDLLDTKTEFTRQWLEAETPFPSLMVVDLRGIGWNDSSRAMLGDWIAFLDRFGARAESAHMLYVLPTDCKFDLNELPLDARRKELFNADCPVLLSLRERVLDVACYLRHALGAELCAGLEPAVAAALLQYSWPEGYNELQNKAAQLLQLHHSGQQLDFAAVMELLAEGSEDKSSLVEQPGMVTFLKRRQREYIQLLREGGEEIKDTLLRIGVEAGAISVDALLADELLLYPEVMDDGLR